LGYTYEGMFLLDNQVVRADWNRAKGAIVETLAKHGAKVLTARRWDERKLAYSIKGKNRGTYLLAYFDLGGDGVNEMRRDFDLDENVLRYLMLRVDAVPAGEVEKAAEESAEGFSVPPPPPEEAQSFERLAFGDLADRPIQEPTRHAPEPEEAPADAPAEPAVPETAGVEES